MSSPAARNRAALVEPPGFSVCECRSAAGSAAADVPLEEAEPRRGHVVLAEVGHPAHLLLVQGLYYPKLPLPTVPLRVTLLS